MITNLAQIAYLNRSGQSKKTMASYASRFPWATALRRLETRLRGGYRRYKGLYDDNRDGPDELS